MQDAGSPHFRLSGRRLAFAPALEERRLRDRHRASRPLNYPLIDDVEGADDTTTPDRRSADFDF